MSAGAVWRPSCGRVCSWPGGSKRRRTVRVHCLPGLYVCGCCVAALLWTGLFVAGRVQAAPDGERSPLARAVCLRVLCGGPLVDGSVRGRAGPRRRTVRGHCLPGLYVCGCCVAALLWTGLFVAGRVRPAPDGERSPLARAVYLRVLCGGPPVDGSVRGRAGPWGLAWRGLLTWRGLLAWRGPLTWRGPTRVQRCLRSAAEGPIPASIRRASGVRRAGGDGRDVVAAVAGDTAGSGRGRPCGLLGGLCPRISRRPRRTSAPRPAPAGRRTPARHS